MDMDTLDIVLWDDPILSTVCQPVADHEFGSGLEDLARRLTNTMKSFEGLGLAAPQVGIDKRMFVFRPKDKPNFKPIVVCNPEMVLSGNGVADQEGCLSLPEIYEQVMRAGHVNMCYRQPDGKHIELILDGWDARIAQHEFDHLNGIMFFDYQDKRGDSVYGARMSKQASKATLRRWDKIQHRY